MYKGQRFVCSGSVQHTAKAGHVVDLIAWDSHCAECGAPYTSSTNPRGDWPPVRRCAEHRGNGPVIGKPRASYKPPKLSPAARRSLAMLGLKP